MSIQKWERAINDQTEMPSDWALQIAARCWCDDDTGHSVMDSSLAVAFARRIDALHELSNSTLIERDELLQQRKDLMGEVEVLKSKIDELEQNQL